MATAAGSSSSHVWPERQPAAKQPTPSKSWNFRATLTNLDATVEIQQARPLHVENSDASSVA